MTSFRSRNRVIEPGGGAEKSHVTRGITAASNLKVKISGAAMGAVEDRGPPHLPPQKESGQSLGSAIQKLAYLREFLGVTGP